MKVRETVSFPSLHKVSNPKKPNENFFYIPYMSCDQVMSILDIMERLNPKRCFEFGAGFSTAFFPRFFKSTEWISVEHLDIFIQYIQTQMPQNVTLIKRELAGVQYENEIISQAKGGLFDFVFVDGEKRPQCINAALQSMRKGGILILHDKNLPEPINLNGKDLRNEFEEYGIVNSFWWGRK